MQYYITLAVRFLVALPLLHTTGKDTIVPFCVTLLSLMELWYNGHKVCCISRIPFGILSITLKTTLKIFKVSLQFNSFCFSLCLLPSNILVGENTTSVWMGVASRCECYQHQHHSLDYFYCLSCYATVISPALYSCHNHRVEKGRTWNFWWQYFQKMMYLRWALQHAHVLIIWTWYQSLHSCTEMKTCNICAILGDTWSPWPLGITLKYGNKVIALFESSGSCSVRIHCALSGWHGLSWTWW